MLNKSFILLFICLFFNSCTISRYVDLNKLLTKDQIEADITFVKSKLQKEHYDLDWENRKAIILNQLDSLSLDADEISIAEFKSMLEPILIAIDDGHTSISGEHKSNRKIKKKNKFGCNLLNDGTIYLKVPNFTDRRNLRRVLSDFDETLNTKEPKRILIDFSNNRGGNVDYVFDLLERTIKNETCFCEKYVLKLSSGYLGWVNDGAFILKKGFRKKGGYLVKPCKKVKPKANLKDLKRFLLIDSTIISGSMLASYHLKNDGYIIVGSQPHSLFNTFGNIKIFKLQNSGLLLNISTARITLNDNSTDRNNDMLIPDIHMPNSSLNEILKRIRTL